MGRYDAAKRGIPSWAILFAYKNSLKNEIEIKNYPDVANNESGLIQLRRMGKSYRLIQVKSQMRQLLELW